jgi:hypothetical protein
VVFLLVMPEQVQQFVAQLGASQMLPVQLALHMQSKVISVLIEGNLSTRYRLGYDLVAKLALDPGSRRLRGVR